MKIGVIGLGLIGGSIFKKGQTAGYDMVGVSRSVKEPGVSDDYNTLKECNLVFVCTPMNKTISVLDKLNDILPSGTIVSDVRFPDTVKIQRVADATHVECGIVGHEYGTFVQVCGYFCPDLWKFGGVRRVCGANAVNLHVPVAVRVTRWADQPRTGFHDTAVTYCANSCFANGGTTARGCFEIYGDEVQSSHDLSFFHV